VLANRRIDKSPLFRKFNDDGSHDQEYLRVWDPWVITEQNMLGHVSNYTNFLLARVSNDMEVDFSYLGQLVAAMNRHGINLDLFVPPVHVTELLLFSEGGVWPLFEKFKVNLLQTTAVLRERYSANIRLFDFGNISVATTQTIKPIDEHTTFDPYFFDPVHFRKPVGDFLLATMLKCSIERPIPDGFGIELTRENVMEHLASERGKLQAFRLRNPDLVEKISKTIGSHRKGAFEDQFLQ